MSKYTKGPWKWDEPSNWRGLDARVFVSEPYGVVAQVPIEAWRPRSIGRANATLIAAAPELLEALKMLTAQAKSWHEYHHGSNTVACDSICALLPACELAIDKAEGR